MTQIANYDIAMIINVINLSIHEYHHDKYKLCVKSAYVHNKQILFSIITLLELLLISVISIHTLHMLMFFLTRLIIELSFELIFWTWIEIESNCSHFQFNSSWIAHIFNLTRLNLTENWINSTQLVKNLSLTSRELNIEIFRLLHYLFALSFW